MDDYMFFSEINMLCVLFWLTFYHRMLSKKSILLILNIPLDNSVKFVLIWLPVDENIILEYMDMYEKCCNEYRFIYTFII